MLQFSFNCFIHPDGANINLNMQKMIRELNRTLLKSNRREVRSLTADWNIFWRCASSDQCRTRSANFKIISGKKICVMPGADRIKLVSDCVFLLRLFVSLSLSLSFSVCARVCVCLISFKVVEFMFCPRRVTCFVATTRCVGGQPARTSVLWKSKTSCIAWIILFDWNWKAQTNSENERNSKKNDKGHDAHNRRIVCLEKTTLSLFAGCAG